MPSWPFRLTLVAATAKVWLDELGRHPGGIIPCGPPSRRWHELVQPHDDRDAIQAAPDDLPVIDLHGM